MCDSDVLMCNLIWGTLHLYIFEFLVFNRNIEPICLVKVPMGKMGKMGKMGPYSVKIYKKKQNLKKK